jgi:starvation-inducible DNA-binding protein
VQRFLRLLSGLMNTPTNINESAPMTTHADQRALRLKSKVTALLHTPSDLSAASTAPLIAALNCLLADVFALHFKTRNFLWHMSGPHFAEYRDLLAEQAQQLDAMTGRIAERVRKLGGNTLRSIGDVARHQRIFDNDAAYVEPSEMLCELCEDNKAMANHLRDAHALCKTQRDIATASLIEAWTDETERRTWFLFESGREQDAVGR